MLIGLTLDGAFPDIQQLSFEKPSTYDPISSRDVYLGKATPAQDMMQNFKVGLAQDSVDFPQSESRLFMIVSLRMNDEIYTYIGLKKRPKVSGRGRNAAGVGIWLAGSHIDGADAVRILEKLHLDVVQRYYDEFDARRVSMASLNMPVAFPGLKTLQAEIEGIEKPLKSRPDVKVGDGKSRHCTIDVSSLPELQGDIGKALDAAQLAKGTIFVLDKQDMRAALKFPPNFMAGEEFRTLSASVPKRTKPMSEPSTMPPSLSQTPSPEFDRVSEEIFARLTDLSRMNLSLEQQISLRDGLMKHIRSLGGEEPKA